MNDKQIEDTKMNKTVLPDKAEWGRQLNVFLRGTGISKTKILDRTGMTRPTLIKILKGNGTHDQLADVEDAFLDILEGR